MGFLEIYFDNPAAVASEIDLYGVLCVEQDAPRDEIRQAFRLASLDNYAVGNFIDEQLQRTLTEAWEVLGTPHRRAEYDAATAAPEVTAPRTPSPHDYSMYFGRVGTMVITVDARRGPLF